SVSLPAKNLHPLSRSLSGFSRYMNRTGMPSTVIMSVAMHAPKPHARGRNSSAVFANCFFMRSSQSLAPCVRFRNKLASDWHATGSCGAKIYRRRHVIASAESASHAPARDQSTVLEVIGRWLDAAMIHRQRAAWMKWAAGRWIERRRHLALQKNALFLGLGIGDRRC